MIFLRNQVYLASYKGPSEKFLHKVTENVIKTVTSSEYSHCELVINNRGYSASERDKGVREKGIDWNSEQWDFTPAPWVDPIKVQSFFKQTDGDGYDFWGLRLFLGLAGPVDGQPRKWWCSEWCAKAMGIEDTRVSPGHLHAWARARYDYWIWQTSRRSV